MQSMCGGAFCKVTVCNMLQTLNPGHLWVKHRPVLAAMCVWGSPTAAGHMMHTHQGRDVQLPRNTIQRVYFRGDKCDLILRINGDDDNMLTICSVIKRLHFCSQSHSVLPIWGLP